MPTCSPSSDASVAKPTREACSPSVERAAVWEVAPVRLALGRSRVRRAAEHVRREDQGQRDEDQDTDQREQVLAEPERNREREDHQGKIEAWLGKPAERQVRLSSAQQRRRPGERRLEPLVDADRQQRDQQGAGERRRGTPKNRPPSGYA